MVSSQRHMSSRGKDVAFQWSGEILGPALPVSQVMGD
jgi:hypothetical protein